MTTGARLLAPNLIVARIFNPLQPLFLLAVRLYVGWQFFKSGSIKLGSWDTTLWLFENEYRTPLLPPYAAAIAGTIGELTFPVLLFIGLYGRLSAVGLFAVNLLAVVSYAHVLLTESYEAALGQHVLWGFMLLTLIVFGPGKLSLDYWLGRRPGGGAAVVNPVSV